MNLRVIEKTEKQNNNTNIIDNPKCLLIIKKIKKYLEMIDVKQRVRSLRIVVGPYKK